MCVTGIATTIDVCSVFAPCTILGGGGARARAINCGVGLASELTDNRDAMLTTAPAAETANAAHTMSATSLDVGTDDINPQAQQWKEETALAATGR